MGLPVLIQTSPTFWAEGMFIPEFFFAFAALEFSGQLAAQCILADIYWPDVLDINRTLPCERIRCNTRPTWPALKTAGCKAGKLEGFWWFLMVGCFLNTFV